MEEIIIFKVDGSIHTISKQILRKFKKTSLYKMWRDSKDDEVALSHIDPQVFVYIMKHMRGYNISLDRKFLNNEYMVRSVYTDAKSLGFTDLADSLEKIIDMNKENTYKSAKDKTLLFMHVVQMFGSMWLGGNKYFSKINGIIDYASTVLSSGDPDIEELLNSKASWRVNDSSKTYELIIKLVGGYLMANGMTENTQNPPFPTGGKHNNEEEEQQVLTEPIGTLFMKNSYTNSTKPEMPVRNTQSNNQTEQETSDENENLKNLHESEENTIVDLDVELDDEANGCDVVELDDETLAQFVNDYSNGVMNPEMFAGLPEEFKNYPNMFSVDPSIISQMQNIGLSRGNPITPLRSNQEDEEDSESETTSNNSEFDGILSQMNEGEENEEDNTNDLETQQEMQHLSTNITQKTFLLKNMLDEKYNEALAASRYREQQSRTIQNNNHSSGMSPSFEGNAVASVDHKTQESSSNTIQELSSKQPNKPIVHAIIPPASSISSKQRRDAMEQSRTNNAFVTTQGNVSNVQNKMSDSIERFTKNRNTLEQQSTNNATGSFQKRSNSVEPRSNQTQKDTIALFPKDCTLSETQSSNLQEIQKPSQQENQRSNSVEPRSNQYETQKRNPIESQQRTPPTELQSSKTTSRVNSTASSRNTKTNSLLNMSNQIRQSEEKNRSRNNVSVTAVQPKDDIEIIRQVKESSRRSNSVEPKNNNFLRQLESRGTAEPINNSMESRIQRSTAKTETNRAEPQRLSDRMEMITKNINRNK